MAVVAILNPGGNSAAQEFAAGLIRDTFQSSDLSTRANFVERLLIEMEKVVRPSNERQAQYRPSPAQFQEALVLVGIGAWEEIEKRDARAGEDDPIRPYLRATMAAIAAEAVPQLARHLAQSNIQPQTQAEEGLRMMGTYSIPALLEILIGDDPRAAERAGTVLAELGIPGYEAMAALMKRPGTSDEVLKRLDTVMERAGKKIARAFENPEAFKRPDGRYELRRDPLTIK